MEESRRQRARRLLLQRQRNTREGAILPVRSRNRGGSDLSSTISCCYCDYKFSAFNAPISRLGRRYSSFLRLWFSIGIGFALTSLLAVSIILIWDLGCALHVFRFSSDLRFFNTLLFGFSPSVYGLRMSLALADIASFCFSTVISVTVHEFGHAIAAASEGVEMEYIAIFIAGIFPGALVAFNYELMKVLKRSACLRIFCAGVWHNAVCCAICAVVLLLLPTILCPFYLHGEHPVVLDVPSHSPLAGFLSPGDIIVSLDRQQIHDEKEWLETTAFMSERTVISSNNSIGQFATYTRKGYCVPSSVLDIGKKVHYVDNESSCPSDLSEFVAIQCDSSRLGNSSIEDDQLVRKDSSYCLNAKYVIERTKCGEGWQPDVTTETNCLCSQDEACVSPVQFPGLIWAEITYEKPYLPECSRLQKNVVPNSNITHNKEHNCNGTFVFIGDIIAVANSVGLTSYRPRWTFGFDVYLPRFLEKIIVCTFHVSLTLALLNSLPVYFLDGESILEVVLYHFTSGDPRKTAKVLQACLLGGTLVSVLAFTRIILMVL